jgi:hypothetical protein
MIAPGSGSGAPGTGQRAESAGDNGKGFLLGLTVLAGFTLDLPAESIATESTFTESVETESVTESAGAIGRGTWIARGAQRGGPESLACSTCLAPTGAFSQPSRASDSKTGKVEERNLASEVRNRCIMPAYEGETSGLSVGS